MAHIILITGGQRSGKSSNAQKRALELSDSPIYLATSRKWDPDHIERIKRHQADRDQRWTTIEEEVNLHQHDFTGKVVLIDCITLWLTNIFFDHQSDVEQSLAVAKDIFNQLIKQDCTFIIVTNEIGMGGFSANELQNKFADLQGWMNQYIARYSDEVFMMIAGIHMKAK